MIYHNTNPMPADSDNVLLGKILQELNGGGGGGGVGPAGPTGPQGPAGDPATQTPWAQDIDAASFDLTSVGSLGIGTATPLTAIELANGTADQAFLITRPNNTSYGNVGYRTGATYEWQVGQRTGNSDYHIFNAQNSSSVVVGYGGSLNVFNSATAGFVDNSLNLLNLSTGYSALAAWFPADSSIGNGRALAIGSGPAGATVYGNRGYLAMNPAGGVGEPPDLVIAQEEDGAGGYLPHVRQLFTGSSGDIDFYSYDTAVTVGVQSLHIHGTNGFVSIGTATPVGLLTLASLAANTSMLTSTGHSLTGANAQSLIDLAGTWNTSGTPTALKLNITNTASNAASLLADFQVGAVSKFRVGVNGFAYVDTITGTAGAFSAVNFGSTTSLVTIDTRGVTVRDSYAFQWASGGNATGAADLVLARDAANTLAQRNGANAQTFSVYNTFTSAANYERLMLQWSSNVAYVSTAAATGTLRPIVISGSTTSLGFGAAPTTAWTVNTSGHFLAATDNTYDIGASGATRPRNYFGAGSIVIGGVLAIGNIGNTFTLVGGGNGIGGLYNAAENDFNRLQFGGTTSSFPSLKRSATVLQSVLADDSGFAPLQGKLRTDTNATTGLTAGVLSALTNASIEITDASGQVYRIPCII